MVCTVLLASCTPNGVLVNNGGGNISGSVTRIKVSIAAFRQASTPAGLALGFSPLVDSAFAYRAL